MIRQVYNNIHQSMYIQQFCHV